MEQITDKKSWISKKKLGVMLLVLFVCASLGCILHNYMAAVIIFAILSIVMLVFVILCFYARYKLTTAGGDIQYQISLLISDKIEEGSTGKLLDIGCGSGALSVLLARKCPGLQIEGIDYWGDLWGYSKGSCEQLAKDYEVDNRTHFQKASASSIPFDDEYFDIVISNMVFHEVADMKDKREVVREAMRVLKKGGLFVFQDLFLKKSLYGEQADLVEFMKILDMKSLLFEKTSDKVSIPGLLNTSLFFGKAALISGRK